MKMMLWEGYHQVERGEWERTARGFKTQVDTLPVRGRSEEMMRDGIMGAFSWGCGAEEKTYFDFPTAESPRRMILMTPSSFAAAMS